VVGDAVPPPTPETATGLSPDWAVGGAVGEVWVATPGWRPDEDSDPPPPPLTAHVASRAATTAIRLNDTISVELRGRWSRRVSAGPSWRCVGGGAGVDAACVVAAGVDTVGLDKAGVDKAGAGRDGAGRDGADRDGADRRGAGRAGAGVGSGAGARTGGSDGGSSDGSAATASSVLTLGGVSAGVTAPTPGCTSCGPWASAPAPASRDRRAASAMAARARGPRTSSEWRPGLCARMIRLRDGSALCGTCRRHGGPLPAIMPRRSPKVRSLPSARRWWPVIDRRTPEGTTRHDGYPGGACRVGPVRPPLALVLRRCGPDPHCRGDRLRAGAPRRWRTGAPVRRRGGVVARSGWCRAGRRPSPPGPGGAGAGCPPA